MDPEAVADAAGRVPIWGGGHVATLGWRRRRLCAPGTHFKYFLRGHSAQCSARTLIPCNFNAAVTNNHSQLTKPTPTALKCITGPTPRNGGQILHGHDRTAGSHAEGEGVAQRSVGWTRRAGKSEFSSKFLKNFSKILQKILINHQKIKFSMSPMSAAYL